MHFMTKLQFIYPFCRDEHEIVSGFWLVRTVLLWFVHIYAHFCWMNTQWWIGYSSNRMNSFSVVDTASQLSHMAVLTCITTSGDSTSWPSLGSVIFGGGGGHPEGCVCMSLWFYWLLFPCGLLDVSLMAFHGIISLFLCVLFVKCPFKSLILFFPCWFVVLYVFWVCVLCQIHVF